MQIKSIAAGAAISLITGVGSVSADELSVADTTADPDIPIALLGGIETFQVSARALSASRGTGVATYDMSLYLDVDPPYPSSSHPEIGFVPREPLIRWACSHYDNLGSLAKQGPRLA